MTGRIIHYNRSRGFGFIEIPGDEPDIFFHVFELPDRIHTKNLEGRTVSFDLSKGLDGRNRAISIQFIDALVGGAK